ncbi:ABC transporter ATP-binding protein [Clostridium sp. 'White wine YQ']|uniref:ABC transporter ATP-binding protein n=1 Tax=Clostridium sp. 'White wine YQ' TaxID=3027474 RepID=UPI002367037A|nr:ABC transporter ATP-binding protein [Clostridium sp. 'White wine YQ']MDD7793414.1 ABC transporter ATP-binding protein [Clostridium sp. 'White wine YQ']
MAIIECTNLTKDYRNTKALDNISFTIEENTITGLIGRNGAGKTTLLKIIAGFMKNTSGEISVLGSNPFNSLNVSTNLFFADDNIEYPASLNLSELLVEISKFYSNWDMSLAEGLFEYFRLNPKQYHSKLSKGQRSTFNVIVALSTHSPITIFDEPTTGMDASVRKDFYRALLKDYISYPRTIIISSHLLSEIEDILENILLIKNGTKILYSSVEEIKEMAIRLRGDTDYIHELCRNKEVIYTEKSSGNLTSVVVKNEFTETDLQQAKLKGIDIFTVSADDLCVYLTNSSQGGIDDVFTRK